MLRERTLKHARADLIFTLASTSHTYIGNRSSVVYSEDDQWTLWSTEIYIFTFIGMVKEH